ncbi:Retrovirus-related Pol polyprotein from transposon TNT 1-94 [Cucumis melo var. makuwa]|uniref:Retrovirus-related Pol polyprotein from transposon TNT 1-94 n=1 Tax=Cucumis melo var. makuwa TaxID=1194695 RepID=A0A5D3DCZ3_CUCMM|nr:Retrovirus-related Pol polyprotein from transposon TNT 1-94 [Cucumis melo var. makuwa]TYK21541.1 Retrovirus-related Pol polyprotein from transposon TNT 1-94 [Cucumis melo var. makuwa]
MVTGLPQIEVPAEVCEECVISKQHRDPFPIGKSWTAKRPLESDKSEAFIAFRSYKCKLRKKLTAQSKQLTAAYMPQQNGICERKNRALLNMVRSLLMKSDIPRTFWPEAVNWSIHILNRSPTLVVWNMTLRKHGANGVFDEENFWQWNKKVAEKQVSTNFDGIDDEESQKPTERDQLSSTDGLVNPPSLSTTSDNEERPQRTRRKPAWMTDYEVTGIDESDDPLTCSIFRL